MTDAIPMTVLKVSHHDPRHMASRYPYAAYGSNLLMRQISERCPNADLMSAGRLLDHRLDFSRVATITLDKTSTVPVGLYQLSANDIERLDKREGMGRVYDRYLVTPICDDGRAVRCFTYIKKETVLEPPTPEYFAKLLGGYRDWHFDDRRLRHARERAQAAWLAGAAEREKSVTTRAIAALDDVRRKYAAKSAGQAWAQGEMWEPVYENVAPLRPLRLVTMRHDEIEWGNRDGEFYFRRKGERVWYRDMSDHEHISRGKVYGRIATNLPGGAAYRPVDKKDK